MKDEYVAVYNVVSPKPLSYHVHIASYSIIIVTNYLPSYNYCGLMLYSYRVSINKGIDLTLEKR